MQRQACRLITALSLVVTVQGCGQPSPKQTDSDSHPGELKDETPADLARHAEEQAALAREDAEKASNKAESAIRRARAEMEAAARKARIELQRQQDEAHPQLRAGKSSE